VPEIEDTVMREDEIDGAYSDERGCPVCRYRGDSYESFTAMMRHWESVHPRQAPVGPGRSWMMAERDMDLDSFNTVEQLHSQWVPWDPRDEDRTWRAFGRDMRERCDGMGSKVFITGSEHRSVE